MRNNWTREELILAINLYCKLPFGKMHSRNPEIIRLADKIGRTPGSIAFKLVNFASLDPSLKARGIKGASNHSKLDEVVWNEFYNNMEDFVFESEELLSKYNIKNIISVTDISDESFINNLPIGMTKEKIIKTRVNQSFFRKMILASYSNTCCISGLSDSCFLIAGHIIPWAEDEKNRLNPSNGILLNALHDKAFEFGFITITKDFTIKVSPKLKNDNPVYFDYFNKYNNQKIILPKKFLPDINFLQYHNDVKFKI